MINLEIFTLRQIQPNLVKIESNQIQHHWRYLDEYMLIHV